MKGNQVAEGSKPAGEVAAENHGAVRGVEKGGSETLPYFMQNCRLA